jgi:hypothetical protein
MEEFGSHLVLGAFQRRYLSEQFVTLDRLGAVNIVHIINGTKVAFVCPAQEQVQDWQPTRFSANLARIQSCELPNIAPILQGIW